MSLNVRLSTAHDADHEAIAEIVNATSPNLPTSVEEIRWLDATYPGGANFLAQEDGRTVGAAIVGRIIVLPPEFDAYWANVGVLPANRRAGVGSALLRAVSDHARGFGKSGLHVPASGARPEGIEFLVNRGFKEHERVKVVELPLAGLTPPPIDPPEGVRFSSLAEDPELVSGVHAVAVATIGDIPGGDTPFISGDLAEFRARDVDYPAVPKDGFIVATEVSSGEGIGYASLSLVPGTSGRVAWHDMTAVVRPWRRRGLATALKRATIGWAISAGLGALQTGNDLDNAPMRAVNARLGYQPLPDLLIMRGPLFDGMMGRT